MKVSLASVLVATALFAGSGVAFSQPAGNTSQGANSTLSQPPMAQSSGSMSGNDSARTAVQRIDRKRTREEWRRLCRGLVLRHLSGQLARPGWDACRR